MEYFYLHTEVKPEKGDLLISEPFLPDPNFERTVILLCEHNEEGTFGFVLNKVSLLHLDDVLEEVETLPEKLFVGGPVEQNTLHFIHRNPEIISNSEPIGHNCYWGGNFEDLLSCIESGDLTPENFRFFLGYSGWSKGQLEEELEANSWIIYKQPEASMIFETDAKALWRRALQQMGGRYRMFSNYPVDPRLN